MHPFDEWFAVTYPQPQPPGTRETALIAWNAAIHAARKHLRTAMDELVESSQYERAAELRDRAHDLGSLRRTHDE